MTGFDVKVSVMRYAGIFIILMLLAMTGLAGMEEAPLQKSIQSYFETHIKLLSEAAEQRPTKKTFRKIMKPLVKDISEFREATLLNTNFVIQQTYYKRHKLAVGYDLKEVDSLRLFHEEMQKNPASQISGPTKAKLMNPSVIVLRHPILDDNKFVGVVSLMVSTDDFLEKVKLADCKAYRIRCSDGIEISKGVLSDNCRKVDIKLPSAMWTVEYDHQHQIEPGININKME